MGFSLFLGERFFPPPSGLSYSTWFCIEHFSTPPNNHPVRLLTVVRRANSSEQHYVCLAIVLSAKDRSLIVSTKEELLQNYGKSCATSSANADSIIGMQHKFTLNPVSRRIMCWNVNCCFTSYWFFDNGKMQTVNINLWSCYNFQRRFDFCIWKKKNCQNPR